MTIEDLLARAAIRDTLAKYHISGDRLKLADIADGAARDVEMARRLNGIQLFARR